MIDRPLPEIRAAAARLLEKGATVVAGHFAHVFHGVAGPVLYDLGDFIDDYATHPVLRNDLGLLFLLTLDAEGPVRLEALPLKLDYCHTRLASGADEAWIKRRFREACRLLGDARRGGRRSPGHPIGEPMTQPHRRSGRNRRLPRRDARALRTTGHPARPRARSPRRRCRAIAPALASRSATTRDPG